MRIAYGVMGYGRGHASRAQAVLPALSKKHEITVFAARDAHAALAPHFPTVEIPAIGYVYGDRGRHSFWRTVGGNLGGVGDLLWHGAGLRAVEQEFRERGIEMVISDSEAWTHRAARNLGLPRISFDHVGVIAWCRRHCPPDLAAVAGRDAWGYRTLMGTPDRILISSFYPAQPAVPQARVIGPLQRPEILAAHPVEGDYLLAYFNQGRHQYGESLDRTLRQLDFPVVVYGTPFEGAVDNLEFRAPSVAGFVRDLAGARAVIATAGNVLIGEALYLRKPLLLLPEDAFEQRLNAWVVEQMGAGMQASLTGLTASDVDRFLGNLDRYRLAMPEQGGDAGVDAVNILEQYIHELGGREPTLGDSPELQQAATEPQGAGPSVATEPWRHTT